MRTYETIYILDPTLEANATEAEINRFNNVITGYGGTILQKDKWGLKNLD